jgi:hypothetical protein
MSREVSFTRLLTERELSQCNRLLCAALLDRQVRECLIHRQDLGLLKAYGLPEDLCQWLHDVPRTSIPELAQVIWNLQCRPYQW